MSRKISINGKITFEPEKKTLSGDSCSVTVSASATYCLEFMIDHKGELVTHEQLYDYAWRRFGMEPTATSLYQNISNIRRSFKKAGLEQDIIRTMPRRGFILSPLAEIKRHKSEPEAIAAHPESVRVLENLSDEPPVPLSEDDKENNSDLKKDDETPRSESDAQQEEKVDQRKAGSSFSGLQCWGLAFLFFLLSALTGYAIISDADNSDSARYFNYFSHQGDRQGCQIYVNRDIRMTRAEIYTAFNKIGLDCGNSKYIYLTTYRYADRSSVISCQKEISSESDSQCHSSYYIRGITDE